MDGRCGNYEHVMMILERVHRSKGVDMFVHACSATRIYRNILWPVESQCAERRGVGDVPWDNADVDRKAGELVVLELCRSHAVKTGEHTVYMAKCMKCKGMYYNDDSHNGSMLFLPYYDQENDDGWPVWEL